MTFPYDRVEHFKELCKVYQVKYKIDEIMWNNIVDMFQTINDTYYLYFQTINVEHSFFPNFEYIFCKICEILKVNLDNKSKIFKSKIKLENYDIIWKWICDYNNWHFSASHFLQ